MKHMKFKKIIMLAGVLAAAGAHADDKFTVNGYGYQDYRLTNNNFFEYASQRGTWDHNAFAVVMSAKVSDRDTAWAQLQASSIDPAGLTRFTWMFLDHRFSDNLSGHVGRIKFPVGLYTEFIDNKALQLSAVIPYAYSGSADMSYDAYSGVGLDWTTGSLFTQIYGGNVYNPIPTNDHANRRLIGTRITWTTPLEGLRFLISANETSLEGNPNLTIPQDPPEMSQLGKEDRAMFSVDYVSDRFDIKGEYNYHKTPPFANLSQTTTSIQNAWYVQGGYKMGLWTPYARYDSFQADQHDTSDPSKYQKDWVLGVNYKINDYVNARIEDHIISGYAMSQPNTPADVPATNWNMLAAEVNFMF